MAKEVVKSVTVRNLNKDIVRFQTYDSAASMPGIYKGVQQIYC